MLDVFQIVNVALIVLLAILICKNKSWNSQPVVLVLFIIILVIFVLTLIFS